MEDATSQRNIARKLFRKQLKKKTVYIKNGDDLELVRDILMKNGESCRMGYDESYKLPNECASKGYLYRVRNSYYISLIKNENAQEISFDEFKLLGVN
jgi:hypothetical protein